MKRIEIARGAVDDMQRSAWTFLGLLAAVVVLAGGAMVGGAANTLVLPAAGALVAALSVGLFVYLNLPGHVELGEDGVLVDTRASRRFVPFSSIDAVERYEETVMGKHLIGAVLQTGGGDVRLPMGEGQFGAPERCAQLVASLRTALDAYRHRGVADTAMQLQPGARDTRAWIEELRRVGEGANAGPREAPVPRERLWRIAEDPTAEGAARAAAAVALRAGLDDGGRARLRIAAEGTAQPEVRAAIEAAVAEDEAAIAEAMEPVRRTSVRG